MTSSQSTCELSPSKACILLTERYDRLSHNSLSPLAQCLGLSWMRRLSHKKLSKPVGSHRENALDSTGVASSAPSTDQWYCRGKRKDGQYELRLQSSSSSLVFFFFFFLRSFLKNGSSPIFPASSPTGVLLTRGIEILLNPAIEAVLVPVSCSLIHSLKLISFITSFLLDHQAAFQVDHQLVVVYLALESATSECH